MVEEARRAYVAMIYAYNRRDREYYFEHLATVLDCYYSVSQYPGEKLLQKRLPPDSAIVFGVPDLTPLKIGQGDAVWFLERSQRKNTATGVEDEFERGVVLSKEGNIWRLTAEVDRDQFGCLPEFWQLAGRESFDRVMSDDGVAADACRAEAVLRGYASSQEMESELERLEHIGQ